MIFDAAHHQRGVALADFRNHYADREAALRAEGACKKIGSVVVLAGGGEDAVLGLLRNGIGHRRPVHHQ